MVGRGEGLSFGVSTAATSCLDVSCGRRVGVVDDRQR